MPNQALLNSALSAHKSGNTALAEQRYLEVINGPENVDLVGAAKQLLGSLYSSLGRYPEAEEHMLASLALQPKQPHVRNNLGVCYKRQGKLQQAMENFNLAISLKPDYLAAYKNLIGLFMNHAMYAQAAEISQIALGVFPQDMALTQQLALAKQGLKHYQEALQLLRELHRLAPEDPSISHNLAVTLRLSNNPTEALEIFERLHAATQTPSYELLQNKGNAHADLGQLEQASECYKQVIKLQPNYVPAHENLTSILWTLGQQSNFVDSFQETIESGLSDVPIQQAYVEALLTAEKPDRALAFLATTSSLLDPEDQRVADFVARCHLARNDTETAIKFHKRACVTRETAVPYWIDYAVTLIVAGEIEQASDILEQLSERAPADQMVLAHLSLCWRMLDDPRARILNNCDLVGEYELPTPPGFSSLAEFNMALNECLTEYHTSEHHPLEQTLRQGTQTQGNLFARENRLLQLLKNSFRGVITRHIKKMQDMPAPYPGFSTERDFDFAASWSVRLRDQGFHTQHIHPMGWFSSAYYVDLPSELESSADDATPADQGGWIKFGEPNLKCTPPLQAQHIVKPKVGKLILFPSYMWHGTIPFKSAETRTTVVFDVAPSDH